MTLTYSSKQKTALVRFKSVTMRFVPTANPNLQNLTLTLQVKVFEDALLKNIITR